MKLLALSAVVGAFQVSTATTACVGYPSGPQSSSGVDSIQEVNLNVLSGRTGQRVTVEGVVVGDLRDTGENKFFLQMPSSQVDEDSEGSQGLMVFCGGSGFCNGDFKEGDYISVTGETTVFQGNPQLVESTAEVIEDDTFSPSDVCPSLAFEVNIVEVSLPLDSRDALRSSTGMLATLVNEDLVVTNSFDLQFGQIWFSSETRLKHPAMTIDPATEEFDEQRELNLRNFLVLDDVAAGSCPSTQMYYSLPLGIRNGWKIDPSALDATTVITYFASDNDFHLKPNSKGIEILPKSFIEDSNPRFEKIEDELEFHGKSIAAGSLRVGGINVLNFFETLGSAGRGADNRAEFELQKEKLYKAINELDAAVLGLEEIENSDDSEVLELLVSEINDEFGLNYKKINTGFVGGDAITTAIIYNPEVVSPSGAFETFTFTNPTDASRPAIAQTFTVLGSSLKFTFVTIHMKSKGSACSEDNGNNVNQVPNEGNCGFTRLKHVEQLLDWLETDPTNSGSPNLLITGDFNSYVMERSVQKMVDAGFVNLGERDAHGDLYSFSFDGEHGTLDYLWASPSMANICGNTLEWHINSDEATLRDYNEEYCNGDKPSNFNDDSVFRCSDHDPIITFCDLTALNDSNEGTKDESEDEEEDDERAPGAVIALTFFCIFLISLCVATLMEYWKETLPTERETVEDAEDKEDEEHPRSSIRDKFQSGKGSSYVNNPMYQKEPEDIAEENNDAVKSFVSVKQGSQTSVRLSTGMAL